MVSIQDSFSVQWGLETRVDTVSGRPVVFLAGDIHSFNAHKLAEILRSHRHDEQLVLDLSAVNRFSPAGVSVLLTGAQSLAETGCTFVLRHPSRTVRAVLDASGMSGHFTIENP